ncbi:MAG: Sec-independent protein translocase subunit TatA/TatB [Chloroflexota bacterium]
MDFLGIGGMEAIVIAGIALLLLGPRKMVETAREAGKITRDIKRERDRLASMIAGDYADEEPRAERVPDRTPSLRGGFTWQPGMYDTPASQNDPAVPDERPETSKSGGQEQ